MQNNAYKFSLIMQKAIQKPQSNQMNTQLI